MLATTDAKSPLGASIGDTCCPPPPSNDPVPGNWVLTFEDDFEGTSVNPEHWTISNWSQVISQNDGHDSLFTAERVSVANGQLRIDTVLETNVFQGVQYNFTSAWIDSQHKVNQTKGRFEARIKMPDAGATGAWPAWWLLPEGNCWPVSGEVCVRVFERGLPLTPLGILSMVKQYTLINPPIPFPPFSLSPSFPPTHTLK